MTNHEKQKSEDEILEIARERYQLAVDSWSEVYKKYNEDTEFRAGIQWDEGDKNDRASDGRPCLTINRIPQFVNQIANDQRQNRPSVKVSPRDDRADIETAKIYQGLIRQIEYASKADAAYDRAFECAVTGGIGFWRLRTDFVDNLSFNQEIIVDRIADPNSVKIDPFSKEPDGSDMAWGFIEVELSIDDYCQEFGESKLGKNRKDWSSFIKDSGGWVSEKSVKIAEYFCKEYEKDRLLLLSNGETALLSKIGEMIPEGISVVKSRDVLRTIIKHRKINGVEILEETIFPGSYIPIIPVYGAEIIVNGKRTFEGIVRHAKDPQKMYNYWATSETELIALAPKAPWIVAEGSIPKEYERQWRTANSKSHAFLPYKPLPNAPPPTRNAYEPPVQAITNARLQSSEDLKSTTGIYDAALGARSNEQSGLAIARRASQAQTSNFHFIDNLSRSIRHEGRIMVEIIPIVYDTEMIGRIIGEEGEHEAVPLNQPFNKNGEQKQYNLGVGRYDVAVETGPSFATKRQEAVASMLDLTRSAPQIAQVASDLMVKNMDWPGASEIAERLKKTLPPGIADDPDKKPIPPEVQQQMTQMSGLIERLTNELNVANEAIKNKRVELESKERIEFAKLEQEATIQLAKLQSTEALQILGHQIKELNQRMSLVGINEPFNEQFSQNEQILNEQMPDQQMFDEQQPTDGASSGTHMEGF